MAQLQLDFTAPTGNELRDIGIESAISHANRVHESWSEQAYEFLLSYIKSGKEFMVEEVREASKGLVPEPPNLRAWGGIITKAFKRGLVKKTNTRNVKNPKAHCANANVWIKV